VPRDNCGARWENSWRGVSHSIIVGILAACVASDLAGAQRPGTLAPITEADDRAAVTMTIDAIRACVAVGSPNPSCRSVEVARSGDRMRSLLARRTPTSGYGALWDLAIDVDSIQAENAGGRTVFLRISLASMSGAETRAKVSLRRRGRFYELTEAAPIVGSLARLTTFVETAR
jgi:hypothetical protein